MGRVTSDTGPFAIVPEWLLTSEVSDRAVRLYAVFGRYADGDGWSFPSRRTLAAQLRCSVSSVDRALEELQKLGAIEVHERYIDSGDQTSNLYRLLRVPPYSLVTTPLVTGEYQNESQVTRGEEANASSRKRAPDELWDALVVELGDVSTKTERGERNSAVKELREAGATADEIHLRCRAYRRRWPDMTLSASALKKHWSSLTVKPTREPQLVEVALGLPEISDEERQENAARIAQIAGSIGKDAA